MCWVAVVRVMGLGPFQPGLTAGNGFTGHEEERLPRNNDFGVVTGLHLECDEVDPAPFPHLGDPAGYVEEPTDREWLAPFEGLLTMDHRSVG
jgi:hypothetical protein